jgi:S-formylglutathione hydrolase FrmB
MAMILKNSLKRFVAICLVALACTQTSVAGIVINDTLTSEVLNSKIPFCVYIPDGFNKNPERTYPVLYLLHGLTDNERAWTEKGKMELVADDLMRSGESREMVIVMPCAGGQDIQNVWNGYFNMPGWNYEDFFFNEFMPAVEKKYRARSAREWRAISGLSMGGGGSVGYALRHPETFCACYAMSAWLGNQNQPQHAMQNMKSKFSYLQATVDSLAATKILNTSTAEGRKSISNVAWFIDCGDDDFLLDQSLEFYQTMRRMRIPGQFRVRDGNHNWEYWHTALRICLPFVSRNMGEGYK